MKKKNLALVPAAAAAAFHLGFSAYTFYEVFGRNAKLPGKINDDIKKNDPARISVDPRVEWMHNQEFTKFTIKNDRGETLSADFLKADTDSKKFILASHGYRSRGIGEFRFISKFYHEHGYNLLLVDHIASGDSEGKYISFGHYESRDLLLWAKFLIENFGEDISIILHGVSMGCATVLMLAGNYELPENVKFVISDCGYSSAKEQFKSVLDKYHVPSKALISTVFLINKAKCGFSLSDVSPIEAVKKIKIPVLFIHGDKDGLVPLEMAKKMYNTCMTEKELLIVSGAGHAESYRKDPAAYEEKILSFTEKYISE